MKQLLVYFIVLFGFTQIQPSQGSTENWMPDSQKGFEIAIEALRVINDEDYESLSEFIHPEKGVIFVPYSFINYEENLVFSSREIRKLDSEIYTWGFYDQSSVTIELTANEYFKRFVNDKDYLNANQIAINGIVRTGNSIENVNEVFKDCIFIDFYDAGTKEYKNLDWSSLKIVMEYYKGELKIVAIIHSSYTI